MCGVFSSGTYRDVFEFKNAHLDEEESVILKQLVYDEDYDYDTVSRFCCGLATFDVLFPSGKF